MEVPFVPAAATPDPGTSKVPTLPGRHIALAAISAAGAAAVATIATIATAITLLHGSPIACIAVTFAIAMVAAVAAWFTVIGLTSRLQTRHLVIGVCTVLVTVTVAVVLAVALTGPRHHTEDAPAAQPNKPVAAAIGAHAAAVPQPAAPAIAAAGSANIGIDPVAAVPNGNSVVALLDGSGASKLDSFDDQAATMTRDRAADDQFATMLGGVMWSTDDEGDLHGFDIAADHDSGSVAHYGERARPVLGAYKTLWVANTDYSKVSPFTSSGIPLQPRSVPGHPTSLGKGFGSVWTTLDNGHVARLAPHTHGVMQIDTGSRDSDALAPGPDGMWVLHPRSGNATPIDPSTNRPGRSIGVGPDPKGFTCNAASLWVMRVDGNAANKTVVERYSTGNGKSLGKITLAGYPVAILNVGAYVVVITDKGTATALRSNDALTALLASASGRQALHALAAPARQVAWPMLSAWLRHG